MPATRAGGPLSHGGLLGGLLPCQGGTVRGRHLHARVRSRKGARQRVEGRHRGGRPGPIQGQASCRGARPLRSGPGSGLRLTRALGVPGAAAGGSGTALPPCCPPGGAPGSFVAGARGGFFSPRGGANWEETGGREGGERAREPRRTGRGGAADFQGGLPAGRAHIMRICGKRVRRVDSQLDFLPVRLPGRV